MSSLRALGGAVDVSASGVALLLLVVARGLCGAGAVPGGVAGGAALGGLCLGAWSFAGQLLARLLGASEAACQAGDLAYLGAALSVLASLCAPGELSMLRVACGVGLGVLGWFALLAERLVVPDGAWLRDRLNGDTVPQVDEVAGAAPYGCTKTMRLRGFGARSLLESHADLGGAIFDVRALLDRSRKLFGSNQLSGTREVLAGGSLGAYRFTSYAELFARVDQVEAHLLLLTAITPGEHRVGLYAKNCEDYIVVMFAALHAGVCVVPLYDSLGHDAVRHVVRHSELRTVFCSEENLATLLGLRSAPSYDRDDADNVCGLLERVFVLRDRSGSGSRSGAAGVGAGAVDRGPRECAGVSIAPFESLLLASAPAVALPAVDKATLAFLLYTSGTTGVPKGVMLSHGGIVSSASALVTTVAVRESDVHLSYLPLAHAFEVCVVLAGVQRGASVGWYAGNVKSLTDDARVLRPTMFIGVPRVMQRIEQVIMQQFALKPWPIRRLCLFAVRAQVLSVRARGGRRNALLDLLVFRQVKAALGGRVRIMCSGSAPLAPSVQEFVKVCFDVPLVEGYGATETSGISHVMLGGYQGEVDGNVGLVGPPLACSEYRLESAPELGYTVEDRPCPRGEVLVRGPNVFKGYFKDAEQTREVLGADGWLRTGDIGRVNASGSLSIIDRRKSLFKLAQGEYVSPELVEQVLLGTKLCGQAFCYGTGFLPHLVALVVPDPLELVPRLRRGAVPGIPAEHIPVLSPQLDSWLGQYHAMCVAHEPAIKRYLQREFDAAYAKADLPRYMWVRDVLIETRLNALLQGLTVENGCLTPTFKVVRAKVQQRYGALLQALLEAVERPPQSSYEHRF
jgi:long-chain acyl-CoA synthetase